MPDQTHTEFRAALLRPTAQECAICTSPPVDIRRVKCGHDFCKACLEEWTRDERNHTCPVCRTSLFEKPTQASNRSLEPSMITRITVEDLLGEEPEDDDEYDPGEHLPSSVTNRYLGAFLQADEQQPRRPLSREALRQHNLQSTVYRPRNQQVRQEARNSRPDPTPTAQQAAESLHGNVATPARPRFGIATSPFGNYIFDPFSGLDLGDNPSVEDLRRARYSALWR